METGGPIVGRFLLQAAMRLRRSRALELLDDLVTAPRASPEEVREAQFRRLSDLLAHAEARVPYYREMFRFLGIRSCEIRSLEDFAALPVLTRAARADSERMQYTMQRLFEVSLILGVWIAVSVGLGSPFAVDVVGGSSFKHSIPVLSVLGGAMIGTFLVATWGHGLLSMRRNRALLGANLLAFALGTGLTLGLAPAYGAIGGAIATTGTELALALTYAVLLVRHRPDLRPSLGVLGPVAAASAAALVPPLLLGTPSVASVAIASVIYFTVLVALRAIPSEALQALQLRR